MKRKLFFPIWLTVFLLAPSILMHMFFMFGTPPDGYPPVHRPLFIPFGAIHFGSDLVEQLAARDYEDALVLFLVILVPILLYTFVLSLGIYYIVRKVLVKSRQTA